MRHAGEKDAILQVAMNTTTTVAVNSPAISLKGVRRGTVIASIDLAPVTPTSAVTLPAASVACPATFSVVVGDATQGESSFAVLGGATVVLGMTTVGQFTGWDDIQVAGSGTIATGLSLVIDGVSFLTATDSCVADYNLNVSNATAFTVALASAISRFCPRLETYGAATAGAGARICIRRAYGPKINASVTAQANHDGISIMGLKQVGVINFDAADVAATNSSYDHFAVRIDSKTTVIRQNVVAILEQQNSEGVSIKSTL